MAISQPRIPVGCKAIDGLLRGGFRRGQITAIYGEAGTGKTTLLIQACVSAAKLGLKVFYVDADHRFTHQRFQQIAGSGSEALSGLVLLFLPESFAEQRRIIESLESYLTSSVGLVVVDSVTSLYRASFSRRNTIFDLNRDLSRQIAYLHGLSSNNKIACVLTSQVHSIPASPIMEVEPVARRTVFHFAHSIIKIAKTPRSNIKQIHLERIEDSEVHGVNCLVSVAETGFIDLPLQI